MKNTWIAFIGLAIFLTIAVSCNKTSLVGAELFENDKLNLQFTDTLTINALNDAPSPFVMSIKNAISYEFLPIGNVPDAHFGKLEAAIYAKFGTNNASLPTFPSLDTAFIDSVRLILPYYTTGIYGDTTAMQKFVVYRLSEELKADTIYSDKIFANDATPLGSLTFKPSPNTPITRIVPPLMGAINTDTFTDAPHVSIPLDLNFGKDIMRLDTSIYNNLDGTKGFDKWLKGLVIKAEMPANCMLNFNMGTSNTAVTGQTPRPAGIYVYYRNKATDTTRQVYVLSTSAQQRYAYIKNDYKNGKINASLGTNPKADSLIYLQGLGGSVARFEVPNLKNLGKIAINKAELEFTINENTDITTFPPLEQLVALSGSARLSNGNLGYLSNVLYLLPINTEPLPDATQTGYSATAFSTIGDFGGYPITENGLRKYKMNLTSHLQRVLTGLVGTQFYVAPHFQYLKAGRVVLYSPKSTKNKAKLNLYYTKL